LLLVFLLVFRCCSYFCSVAAQLLLKKEENWKKHYKLQSWTLTSDYSPEIAARICEVLNDDGTANMHISPLIKPHIKEERRKLEEALQTAEMLLVFLLVFRCCS
ncbi:hypothetical protein L9F63_012541, partial [Diploptera punctata]